ncbi:MAG: 4Fe-4S dicluster domain-containing protein [Firmicutes bacterium]|nr:4Fe-4S dicluster domain-containing protein [Bacillota bacterium]
MSTPELGRARAETSRCIHCGYCLPACPTYQVFGQEKHSPRGRIQLVKAWAEGRAPLDSSLEEALDLCLGCRACETACPVNVEYGIILEDARDELARLRRLRPIQMLLRPVLRHLVAHPRRLRFLARAAGRLLRSRVGRGVHSAAARRPGSWMAAALTFLDALPPPNGRDAVETVAGPGQPGLTPVEPPGTHRATGSASQGEGATGRRVALFLGCAQEGLFPEVNRATAGLLRKAGFDVVVPRGQGCCGALHRHQGDEQHARALARRNLQAFGALPGPLPYDAVVFNAGGCLAWIKEMASLFQPGTRERLAAERLAQSAQDVSQLLHAIAFESKDRPGEPRAQAPADAPPAPAEPGRKPLRVVYQPSCHLTHVCGVQDAPLKLLQALPGIDATLPADGGSCCGSAGIYNALHPEASAAILARKMEHVASKQPDVIVTSNPGCHLQMLAGAKAHGLADRVVVMQLPEFLAWYLSGSRKGKGDG